MSEPKFKLGEEVQIVGRISGVARDGGAVIKMEFIHTPKLTNTLHTFSGWVYWLSDDPQPDNMPWVERALRKKPKPGDMSWDELKNSFKNPVKELS